MDVSAIRRIVDSQLRATLAVAILVCAVPGFAQKSSSGFVYVMINSPAGNEVIQYNRAADGLLSPASNALTGGLGGTGNGVGALDPLGSQNSLVLGGDGAFLLAVNAGSNTLSALSADSTGVHLLNTVSSSGSFPNSVALSGSLVYVLNAHGTPNISGFRLGSGGLAPLPGSTANLPGGSGPAPHDVRFSPDGTRLLVSEGGTNRIDVFELNDAGVPVSVKSDPSAGEGPFGINFGRYGVLLSAEANPNSVSSYFLESDNALSVVSAAVPNGQMATCWISVTAGGKFAFVSNTASGDLSAYAVSGNGTLNLEQAVAATADGGNPIDSALSADSSFLYVVDRLDGAHLDLSRKRRQPLADGRGGRPADDCTGHSGGMTLRSPSCSTWRS